MEDRSLNVDVYFEFNKSWRINLNDYLLFRYAHFQYFPYPY